MLYPETYSYLSDVLSYVAVGARSVENQQHRLVSSGMRRSGWHEEPDQRRLLRYVKCRSGWHSTVMISSTVTGK